mgnify:CR=1 FL=1
MTNKPIEKIKHKIKHNIDNIVFLEKITKKLKIIIIIIINNKNNINLKNNKI